MTPFSIALAIFLSGATFDAGTTAHNMLSLHYPESNLYLAWTKCQPVGVMAVSAIEVATVSMVAHKVDAHHPKLARVLLVAGGSVHFYYGTQNALVWHRTPSAGGCR
jgi:hypothetical protein